jgi:hypothetical protein
LENWNELTKQFTSNFSSTYKQPISIEEIKACTQRHNKSIHSYIQQCSVIKNAAEGISNERAVNAFITGLRRPEFIEEMGRNHPQQPPAPPLRPSLPLRRTHDD